MIRNVQMPTCHYHPPFPTCSEKASIELLYCTGPLGSRLVFY